MSAPTKLLRNVWHPAKPTNTPFDDLQVSILAALFVRFRPLYDVNRPLLCKVLHQEVIEHLEAKQSYTAEKTVLRQECVQVSVDNVKELLCHFDSLPLEALASLEDVYARQISDKSERTQFQLIVTPRITECLFCSSCPLTVKIRTHKCGWKAPGGHSWAYSLHTGATVAAVCESCCPKCKTVYKLQSYTPGAGIVKETGASSPHRLYWSL